VRNVDLFYFLLTFRLLFFYFANFPLSVHHFFPGTGLKRTISTWAKGKGSEKTRLSQFGNGGGVPWGYGCANTIVFSNVKKALGKLY
jgi:hypothetical protein